MLSEKGQDRICDKMKYILCMVQSHSMFVFCFCFWRGGRGGPGQTDWTEQTGKTEPDRPDRTY